jgi:hypothetical protein
MRVWVREGASSTRKYAGEEKGGRSVKRRLSTRKYGSKGRRKERGTHECKLPECKMKVSVKYGMKKLPLLSHSAASFLVK